MVDLILEPETCSHCGQKLPAPADGKWRYAKSGKLHETEGEAEKAVKALNARDLGFEFRVVVDAEDRIRIASRRKR